MTACLRLLDPPFLAVNKFPLQDRQPQWADLPAGFSNIPAKRY
jgi:hypothetical protein